MKPYTFLIVPIILIIIVSCHKEDDPVPPDEIKSIFQATIGGKEVKLVESDSLISFDDYIIAGPSIQKNVGNTDSVIFLIGWETGKPITPDNVTGIIRGPNISVNFVHHFDNSRFNDDGAISYPLFLDIFKEGDRNYSQHFEEEEGVIIEWLDETGERWTSSKCWISTHFEIPVDPKQNDSHFTVTKSVSLNDKMNDSNHYQYIELEFGCNLYNSTGELMTIKNAKLSFVFRTFFRIVEPYKF
ncbi:MAG: hypothetical protein ACK5M7_13740 [Draconibacterium sp.]